MRGMGRIFKRGSTWWIGYNHRGKEHRESSNSPSEAQARRLLKKRLTEVNAGKFTPNEDRLSFEDLVQGLVNDYKVNARRSLETTLFRIQHLRRFFGMDRAIHITTERVKAFQVARLEEGAAPATINRETACLRRMLNLALHEERLSRVPRMKMLEGERVREGFVEHANFQLLLSNLPEYLSPLIEFLYLSGWRKSEGQKLQWTDVSLRERTVRLRIGNSKNKEARILPLTGRLWDIFQDMANKRRLDCPYVFHRDGNQIRDFRWSWKKGCKLSGVEGLVVHDMKRCTARNLSRAGVPESVAMAMIGHKTRSMFRRYRIINENDLREAAERLQTHLEQESAEPVIVPIGGQK